MIITVRDVTENDFKQFRSLVVSKGIKTGTALSQAMREWAGKEQEKKQRKKSFFDSIKPSDWGPGTENSSMEVDKYAYGEFK